MKAMLLYNHDIIENNPLKYEDIDIPTINKDEVLIKVKVCGVCRTDLHTVEGDIKPPKLPIIIGHEIVGEIVDKGENVTNLNIGDIVGVPWFYSGCQSCFYCKRGEENLCENPMFTGFHVNGGYAQYTKIHKNSAYIMPKNYDYEESAPLLCAGVVGYRSYRLTPSKENQIIGMYGFGASAHVILEVAQYENRKVFVFSRSQLHLEKAKEMGADWVGTYNDTPPEKPDHIIIFAPAGELVVHALKNVKRGGQITLAGIYMTDIPQFPYDILYFERSIKSVANSTREDVIDFLKFAEKHKIHTHTEIFPLKDANKVLQMVKHSEIKASAVLKID